MSPLRTSANDPLRVDFIAQDLLRALGRLGLTIAPGKVDLARGWQRDLDADLERLREVHRANLLVSLIEYSELELLGIDNLHSRARAHGLRVKSLPVRDVSVPSPGQLDVARELVLEIDRALDAGDTVVIHCRGGLGRSGLLAACVLKGRGLDTSAALRAVRAARPGAIETAEQVKWVEDFRPPRVVDLRTVDLDAAATREPIAPPSLDRVLGCILGGAIGDALGYPIEFIASRAEIVQRFGSKPPSSLHYAGDSHFSDDTQMTMFVVEGLIRATLQRRDGVCNPHHVGLRALLRWYATQAPAPSVERNGWLIDMRGMNAQRAPGLTCMSALAARARSSDLDLTPAANNSKGCGGVMRAAPFGFLASPEMAFEHATINAGFTHGHPTGYLAAGYLAVVIWHLARGSDAHAALAAADRHLADQPDNLELVTALDRARLLALNHPLEDGVIERLGAGWVAEEALAIAIACLLFHERSKLSVAETLWLAAAHGGDSDSTAAITGNLLGALLGAAALPATWLDALELRPALERLARDLHSCATGPSSSLSDDDYPPL